MLTKVLGRRVLLFGGVLTIVLAANVVPVFANNLTTTTLVTNGLDGKGANKPSDPGTVKTLSDDGRITVFSTAASNIVPGDFNDAPDVFAYDRLTKKTTLISATSQGRAANGESRDPSISADGRFIAYLSRAKNIIQGTLCGVNDCLNLIVHDRLTGKNTFANLNALGQRIEILQFSPPVISADGTFVVFDSFSSAVPRDPNDTNKFADVLVRDLAKNTTKLASVNTSGKTGAQPSYAASVSQDGRFITFATSSSLVSEDTNGWEDIYLRDMQQNTTSLVSTTKSGGIADGSSFDAVISSDGRSVAFVSQATNLVPNDTNRQEDIFLRDLTKNTLTRVNVANGGAEANDFSYETAVSKDGRYVVFTSAASSLVRMDTNAYWDVFIYYRDYGITRRVNTVSRDGPQAIEGNSYRPAISGDGTAVAFFSSASNLHTTKPTSGIANVYLTHNPVVSIPYYNGNDFLDLPGF